MGLDSSWRRGIGTLSVRGNARLRPTSRCCRNFELSRQTKGGKGCATEMVGMVLCSCLHVDILGQRNFRESHVWRAKLLIDDRLTVQPSTTIDMSLLSSYAATC